MTTTALAVEARTCGARAAGARLAAVSAPLRSLLGDVSASLVGFSTLFPVCVGLAVMAELPASAGIVGAFVGSTLVALLVSVPVQVNVPTTSLLLVSTLAYRQFGMTGLACATVLTGLLQLAASRMKLGRWFHALAPSIVEGVLAGTAVTIVAHQVWSAGRLDRTVWIATLALLAVWPSRWNPLKKIPGVLAVTILVSMWVACRHGVPTAPAPLLFEPRGLELTGFGFLAQRDFYLSVLTIFVISTSKALATASSLGRHAAGAVDFDRDLAAFGVGNVASGLLGGLPLSANLGASSVLVQAGGRSVLANALQGIWIVGVVLFVPALFSNLPAEVTVGVTLYSVVKLLSLERLKTLRAVGNAECYAFVLVAIAAVAFGINEAMILGVALSVVRLATAFSASLAIECAPADAANTVALRLRGPLTVLGLPRLYAALTSLPPGTTIHVDTAALSYCDAGSLAKWRELERAVESRGGRLVADRLALAALAQRAAAPATERLAAVPN